MTKRPQLERLAYAPREFAEMTSLSIQKVRMMMNTGELENVRVGRRRLITATAVRRLVSGDTDATT